jgi:hypothetical protein
MSANGDRERERRVRLATGPLAVGALGTVAGVVLSLLGAGDFAAAMTLSGATLLLYGLHRLGRLGADPPAALQRGDGSEFGAQHPNRDSRR